MTDIETKITSDAERAQRAIESVFAGTRYGVRNGTVGILTVNGYSPRQIGEHFGIKTETVRTIFSKHRKLAAESDQYKAVFGAAKAAYKERE